MNRKEDQARLDGMAYALRQIKAHGMDDFEKELVMRGRRDLAIPISQQDLIGSCHSDQPAGPDRWKSEDQGDDTGYCPYHGGGSAA